MERAVLFVDGRYTLQAREQVDASLFAIEHLVETPPDRWIEQQSRQQRPHRLRSLAAHGRSAERLAQGLRRGRRHAGRGRARPDRRDLERSPCAAARRGHAARPALRRRGRPRQARAHPREARRSCAPTRWSCPIRTRSPGPFNIRGADVAHTPLPLAFAIVPQRGTAVALCRRPQACRTTCATASKRSPTCASRADFVRALERARHGTRRPCGSTRRPPPTRWRALRHGPRWQGRPAAPIRSR